MGSYQHFGVCMFSKRSIVIVSTFILTALTFVICFSVLKNSSLDTASANNVRIVLDAGHGGIDGGVSGVSTGVKESDLNLLVVRKVENLLIAGGFDVTLTRSTDAGLYGVATKNRKKNDMKKRKEIIESVKPTVVVSIHMNYYPLSTRTGAQVFYKENDENGLKLASSIQKCFNELNSRKDYKPLTGDYYMLNCTDYTSVIAECGFLSNPDEEKKLISDEYQDEIAYAVFSGIVDYLSQTTFVFCY